MPVALTAAQIDADCLQIISRVEVYSHPLADLFRVLYNTGCREGEIMDRSRWSMISPSLYQLQPQKGNPPRSIPTSELPSVYRTWIASPTWPGSITSVANLRRISRAFTSYPGMSCGAKGISSHIFRHNRIKQLFLAGHTVAQIQAIMGLTSASIVNGYGSSVIMG